MQVRVFSLPANFYPATPGFIFLLADALRSRKDCFFVTNSTSGVGTRASSIVVKEGRESRRVDFISPEFGDVYHQSFNTIDVINHATIGTDIHLGNLFPTSWRLKLFAMVIQWAEINAFNLLKWLARKA